jgi:hypothetical protein
MILDNRYLRRPSSISHVAASALVAVGLISCSQSYHQVPAATFDGGSQREYAQLLVVTRDGYELELVHAFIRADSVVGFVKGRDRGLLEAREAPQRFALAHDQIVRVESYERDLLRHSNRGAPPPADTADMRGVICTLFRERNCPPPPAKTPPHSPSAQPMP